MKKVDSKSTAQKFAPGSISQKQTSCPFFPSHFSSGRRLGSIMVKITADRENNNAWTKNVPSKLISWSVFCWEFQGVFWIYYLIAINNPLCSQPFFLVIASPTDILLLVTQSSPFVGQSGRNAWRSPENVYVSLRKQPTFDNATTGFPTKWHLRNECS